jgi:hypothetical protein
VTPIHPRRQGQHPLHKALGIALALLGKLDHTLTVRRSDPETVRLLGVAFEIARALERRRGGFREGNERPRIHVSRHPVHGRPCARRRPSAVDLIISGAVGAVVRLIRAASRGAA